MAASVETVSSARRTAEEDSGCIRGTCGMGVRDASVLEVRSKYCRSIRGKENLPLT